MNPACRRDRLLVRIACRRPPGDGTTMQRRAAAARDEAHGGTRRAIHAYRPRATEHTVLHRIVREHLATLLAAADAAGGVPPFVEREFRQFLGCGVWARGFARFRCGTCHAERLVPFSCKARAVCPSCWEAADGPARRASRRSRAARRTDASMGIEPAVSPPLPPGVESRALSRRPRRLRAGASWLLPPPRPAQPDHRRRNRCRHSDPAVWKRDQCDGMRTVPGVITSAISFE